MKGCRPLTTAGLFDAVFVINLRHRADRLASIMHELTRSGVDKCCSCPIERFPAVEGSKLDQDVLHQRGFVSKLGRMRLDAPAGCKIWGMDLNAGGLGCAMSHILLWSRIAARRLQRVLVVEDDSLFPPDGSFVNRLVDKMDHDVPHDWQLVYLSGLDTEHHAPLLSVGRGVSRVPRMHRTTNCYLINHHGARSLLDTIAPLTYQLDTQMTATTAIGPPSQSGAHLVGRRGDVPYAITPPCCYTLQPPIVVQATRFGTDIQEAKADADQTSPKGGADAEETARINAAGWSTSDGLRD